ncbi:MAG: STAS domain-containing protein [Candidatus Muirbacterium halophilum]|nr:STAS domain-containing protein [Candidatus Muirbacterium halophilum]MCK9475021.1 STAS domain-containing protein [Candidatus Muirbacterium halophilum]
MEINVKKNGDIFVVKPSGNMNYEDINIFSGEVVNLIHDNFQPKFIFDFGNMAYINSATIGKFAAIFKLINHAKGVVIFCNVRPFVKNILDITKLSTVFDICDSLGEAIETAKKR